MENNRTNRVLMAFEECIAAKAEDRFISRNNLPMIVSTEEWLEGVEAFRQGMTREQVQDGAKPLKEIVTNSVTDEKPQGIFSEETGKAPISVNEMSLRLILDLIRKGVLYRAGNTWFFSGGISLEEVYHQLRSFDGQGNVSRGGSGQIGGDGGATVRGSGGARTG